MPFPSKFYKLETLHTLVSYKNLFLPNKGVFSLYPEMENYHMWRLSNIPSSASTKKNLMT